MRLIIISLVAAGVFSQTSSNCLDVSRNTLTTECRNRCGATGTPACVWFADGDASCIVGTNDKVCDESFGCTVQCYPDIPANDEKDVIYNSLSPVKIM